MEESESSPIATPLVPFPARHDRRLWSDRAKRPLWGPHLAFVNYALLFVKVHDEDVSADQGCEG